MKNKEEKVIEIAFVGNNFENAPQWGVRPTLVTTRIDITLENQVF